MAIGGASGYLTVNPTHDYVGQALQGASDSFVRVRAEKIAQERDRMINEQNLQEQRRRDFKDAEEFSAKYPFVAMGNTSIDSKNRQDLETGKQKYSEAMDNYYQTGDKKYLAVADSVKASINEATEMPKALSLVVEGWQKNESDLNPSSLEKAKNFLQKLKTDTVRDYDENGRAVYTIVDRDASGNPVKILHNKITGEQVKELLNVEPKFNVTGEKGINAQFIKSLGKPTVNSQIKGNNKITTTSYPEAESVAETMANEATQNHSGVYYALEQLKLDPDKKENYSDPKVLEQVKGYFKKSMMDLAQPGVVVDNNFEAANYALSLKKEANDERQRRLDNTFKEKEFNQKQIEDGYVTVGQTKYIFTPEGKAAQKKFYSNPDNKGKAMTAADYPADQINYYVERTSKKVNPDTLKNKGYTDVKKTGSGMNIGKKNGQWHNVDTGEKIKITSTAKTTKSKKEIKGF